MVERIPWKPAKEWLAIIGGRPHACLLTGRWSNRHSGRWSVVSADPLRVSVSRGGDTWINEGHKGKRLVGSPFEAFEKLMALVERYPSGETPFVGMAAGYFSYELGNWFERLPAPKSDDLHLPDAWWGWYDTAVVLDDERKESWIVGTKEKVSRWKLLSEQPARSLKGNAVAGTPKPSMDRSAYRSAVQRIHDEIEAGNVYQVNLTYRLEADFEGGGLEVMDRALDAETPPYAAYLHCGDHEIVSVSPELFVKRNGRHVETHPMKGTRPRGTAEAEDNRLKGELLESEKEKAEHVMIVDLERNDVGRVASPATVRVEDLFRVEAYPTVWQMVSSVMGELPERTKAMEVLRAMFPGGSVTGAPKIRAMELIHELEPLPRRVYTGALGWIGWDGGMVLNMPIRTLVIKDGRACFHVGGGITIDSDPEQEFEETVVKSKAMLHALGRKSASGAPGATSTASGE